MESNGKRFLIRPLRSEDVEEVSRLFTDVFTEREPIASHLKVDKDTFYSHVGKVWTEVCSQEDLSFICLDTARPVGEQVIGFRLSETLEKSIFDNRTDEDASDAHDPQEAIVSLISEYKNAWFEKHPELEHKSEHSSHCVFFIALGVKEGYENCGIASRLLEYSINHAKISGHKYVYVIASAAATQHIFPEKYKFTQVLSKNYADIEYKGNHYLEGISNPPKYISFELDLNNWDVASHQVSNCF